MAFKLMKLPYALSDLEPYMSQKTLEFHYQKHHAGYVTNLNKLIGDVNDDLESVIGSSSGLVFNNSAQIWNHNFFWQSMSPGGGGAPPETVVQALSSAFGSVSEFKKLFSEAALSHFGSGWAWLVNDGEALQIMTTSDADLPLMHSAQSILTIDVWEHAYYLDHQNRRVDYINTFVDHLLNWSLIESLIIEP
ncbi:MAG: superoxide dismutase [Actinomycetota bacterium]|nr:superoxide dismutase [Actinomycetota bacterium]